MPLNERISELNLILKELAEQNGTAFIDAGTAMVNSEGKLRSELHVDGLHLSKAGYDVWGEALTVGLARCQQRSG